MLYGLLALAFCVAFLAASGIIFSRNPFWKEISELYPCSRQEFSSQEYPKIKPRFLFLYAKHWESTNVINIKVGKDHVYLGASFFLDLFIKPIKIPKDKLIKVGYKKYYLKERIVVEINPSSNPIKKIAISKELVNW